MKICAGKSVYLNTNCGNNPKVKQANASILIGISIDLGLSSLAVCSLLASPRREMLIVFVKQRIAMVPTKANEARANKITINTPKLFISRALMKLI